MALTTDSSIVQKFEDRLNDLVLLNRDLLAEMKKKTQPMLKMWKGLKHKHPLACELLNFDPEQKTGSIFAAVPDLNENYWLDSGGCVYLEDDVWSQTKWNGLVNWFKRRNILAVYTTEEGISVHEYILKTIYALLERGELEKARQVAAALLLFVIQFLWKLTFSSLEVCRVECL